MGKSSRNRHIREKWDSRRSISNWGGDKTRRGPHNSSVSFKKYNKIMNVLMQLTTHKMLGLWIWVYACTTYDIHINLFYTWILIRENIYYFSEQWTYRQLATGKAKWWNGGRWQLGELKRRRRQSPRRHRGRWWWAQRWQSPHRHRRRWWENNNTDIAQWNSYFSIAQ